MLSMNHWANVIRVLSLMFVVMCTIGLVIINYHEFNHALPLILTHIHTHTYTLTHIHTHTHTHTGPPAIILNPNDPQRNVSVAEGTRVVLNCPFLSNPAPDFTRWLNPNNEIITESVGSRFQDFPNGTLIISVVRSQDSGSYTCEINNSFGKSAFTYNLVAIGK